MATLLVLCTCSGGAAYQTYQDRIPNGLNLGGVGHAGAPVGGGERNLFGQAFKNAGFVWTAELCRADSDGDGQSNVST